MALYLVQHGKNRSKDQDPEKGLSDEGRREVERIASVAAGYGVQVSRIRHSGKKRARETAELIAEALNPSGGLEAAEGMGPLDDVERLAPSLKPEENLMLVGHLPFLDKLLSLLVLGEAGRSILRFQNGGILCLDRDSQGQGWWMRWTLMPHIG
jgi:phosphohistidine phosphatase